MLEENTLHHRPGAIVIDSRDPKRSAMLRVISYTTGGLARVYYLDPRKQRDYGPASASSLLVDPKFLYPPTTFQIPYPEPEEGVELWTAASRN